jgi:glucose/arabinose dehydrogenase
MTHQPTAHQKANPTAVAAVLLAATVWCSTAQAQLFNTAVVAQGLNQPVYATAPLNDGRVFVVEKGGTIRVAQGGRTSTFLTLPVSTTSEQGLLGLAFDPGYANAASAGYRRFFVNYIDATTQDTVVASYRTTANASVADAASRQEVIRLDQPNGLNNHKAGWIGFKPGDSNHLFIATGDGGGSNDPNNRAQNLADPLGKLLRIDVNRDDFASANINYGIPLSNPFVGEGVGVAGARGEVFASGLRNPWRNSFDRANGNLWLADVGQGAREEVNFISASSAGGQNFGWRVREGRIATPGVGGPATAGMVDPVLDYARDFGQSITGGYVVREAGSALFGQYVFGDFVTGRIFAMAGDGSALTMASTTELTASFNAGLGGVIGNVASFGEGALGELFVVDYRGKVLQITSAVPEPGTVALWAVGLTGLWLGARRKGPAAAAGA